MLRRDFLKVIGGAIATVMINPLGGLEELAVVAPVESYSKFFTVTLAKYRSELIACISDASPMYWWMTERMENQCQ